MKKTKIIIPALGMLLLSTAASVSGTVAWFSMNNSVNVTGMTVTTKVSSNLQISETNVEANFADELNQSRSGILEPASSVNGVNFYYTTSARGDGSAIANTDADSSNMTFNLYSEAAASAIPNTYAGKANYDDAFNNAYGFENPSVRATDEGADNICYGYIDYSFYIKGTYANVSHKISLTKCEIAYNNNSAYENVGSALAWRVGMFVAKANASQEIADSTVVDANNLVTILDFAGSKNQNEANKQVVPAASTTLPGTDPVYYTDSDCTTPAASGTADGTTAYWVEGDDAPKAVSGTTKTSYTALGAKANAAAVVDNAPVQGTTQRYKVVVRLWLEGEDISCTNTTFANLTSNWKLDLTFKQGQNADENDHTYDPVTNISTPAAA